jgi:hypothetical protein
MFSIVGIHANRDTQVACPCLLLSRLVSPHHFFGYSQVMFNKEMILHFDPPTNFLDQAHRAQTVLPSPVQQGGGFYKCSLEVKMSQPIKYFSQNGGNCRRSRSRKKGGGQAALLSCKSRRNPAVELYLEMHAQNVNALDPAGMIALADEIDSTLAAGIKQNQQVLAALARLARATQRRGCSYP